jgi:leucyl aminopeptidase
MAQMKITIDTGAAAASRVDVLAIAVGQPWTGGVVPHLDRLLHGQLSAELVHHHFTGAEGENVIFQTHGILPARTLLVVGTGEGTAPGSWYHLAHIVVRRAHELRAETAAVALPEVAQSTPAVGLVAEGAILSAYTFDRLKSTKRRPSGLRELILLVARRAARIARAVQRARLVAGAACYARDLVNLPAAIATPAYLADEARRIARAQRLSLRVLDGRAMKRLGMGALLGVAQGSSQVPFFLELSYTPDGATRARRTAAASNPRVVALCGKGITFDSGGLSIKPSESMQTQKRDMAGGAAVLAAMSVVRALAVPVAVRAYVPATENMPSGAALKPGDVVRAFNGKTIEVLNTDAEGRLVLADALAYAAAKQPTVLIDLATLTAAVRVALGTRYAAIMGTDPTLVHALIDAGRECGESLWELPLVAAYRGDIDSTVADIKNVGDGGAGTIIGGLFLREFVGDIPWAHIDFSSTVMTDKPFPCHPRGATGYGVRTVLRYLSRG